MNTTNLTAMLNTASIRTQLLETLFSKESPSGGFNDIFELLKSSGGMASDQADATGLIAGRNMALNDPESGYRMMTEINRREVLYKAQFSEMREMQASLTGMEGTAVGLADSVDPTDSAASIQTDVAGFVDKYNSWVDRFAPDLASGGLLAGTRAAEMAQYELEQSVANRFFGAKAGLNGLRDLGVSIDPVSHRASFDPARLDVALNRDKAGAVEALDDFAASFAKSADLLNAQDNYMPRQINNLRRGIQFISDNKTDLQAEFGLGDLPHPSGKIAEALAAYQRNYVAA